MQMELNLLIFGFGADQTGNWHQVTYPGTTKTAWVKEEDKTTFSGNGHVTGIYSVETTSVSGQDVLIMREARSQGKLLHLQVTVLH